MYLTHDQAVRAIQQLHPTMTHGVEYLVLMGIEIDGTPASDAWIERWPPGIPMPTMQELRDAYAASLQAPPPEPPPATSCTSLQFMGRFSEAESTAIYTAATQSPQLLRFVTELAAAQEVVFADPRLAAGMDALVSAGLITQARSEEILPLGVRTTGVPQA